MSKNFSQISVGDTIRVTVLPLHGKSETHTIVVGGVFHDPGTYITSDDGKHVFFAGDDGRTTFEMVEFANGLPEAPVITWAAEDGMFDSATVYGHPGNGVWTYRGRRVESKALLAIIGPDAYIHAYDERF